MTNLYTYFQESQKKKSNNLFVISKFSPLWKVTYNCTCLTVLHSVIDHENFHFLNQRYAKLKPNLDLNKGGEFHKKLWCCVSGGVLQDKLSMELVT